MKVITEAGLGPVSERVKRFHHPKVLDGIESVCR